MEEYVIKNYREFLEENELKNTIENIDLYISGLYYDIMDDLDLERENFGVPSDLTNNSAEKYIEEKIKEILMKEVH